MMIQMWSQYVSLIFHADPHPANIIVQANNKIVFIDFGACGTMNRPRKEAALDQLQYFHKKDVIGFVQATLAFMDPLPPIDVTQFSKELEIKIGQNLQKIWSKRAAWYEKTTATNWFAAFNLARKYRVHINVDTVRAFRANLLYDTLALRVCPELQPDRVSRKFLEHFDVNTKRRAGNALRKGLSGGLSAGSVIRSVTDITNVMSRGMKNTRRMLDKPVLNFAYMIEKPAFVILEVIKLAVVLSVMLLVGWACVLIFRIYHRMDLHLIETLRQVATSRYYQVAAVVVSLFTIRRIMIRLGDADVE